MHVELACPLTLQATRWGRSATAKRVKTTVAGARTQELFNLVAEMEESGNIRGFVAFQGSQGGSKSSKEEEEKKKKQEEEVEEESDPDHEQQQEPGQQQETLW